MCHCSNEDIHLFLKNWTIKKNDSFLGKKSCYTSSQFTKLAIFRGAINRAKARLGLREVLHKDIQQPKS